MDTDNFLSTLFLNVYSLSLKKSTGKIAVQKRFAEQQHELEITCMDG